MADELALTGQTALEERLVELGRSISYPPTPEIAARVRTRLSSVQPAGRAWWSALAPWPQALTVGLIAFLVSVGALLTASPQARTAVADRLGLRGVSIEQRTAPPLPAGSTASLAAALNLGDLVTLEEARVRAGFPVVVPASRQLGAPDTVHFLSTVPGGQVALVFGPRPGITTAETGEVGLLIFEFRTPRGWINEGVLGKLLAAGTRIENVEVNGERGLWIDGDPHVLYVPDARGDFRTETVRLAGNVLLWERGEITLRLEGAASKEVALRIAASMS